MNKGMIVVVSGPSGAGKGTLLNETSKYIPFYFSVSATTRKPRPGECDGVDYYYITREKFEELIASGGMLEYAEYCGNLYGSPRNELFEYIDNGKMVVMDIETQGAEQVKKCCPDALFIFVAPPSLATLKKRLIDRGTESDEVIERRLQKAREELPKAEMYDYVVINDELSEAVEDIKAIIRAESIKRSNRRCAID